MAGSAVTQAGADVAHMLGRRAERDAVDHLLVGAQAGSSGVLVVCGDAGIGKTSLLEHVRASATTPGLRVDAPLGAAYGAPLAFGGVHQADAMSDRQCDRNRVGRKVK